MTDPIEAIALKLARKAKAWDDRITASDDDIAYYLAIEINFWGVVMISAAIGAVTGTLPGTIIAIFTLWISRFYTGGAHAPTLSACFVFSIFVITVCSSMDMPSILLQLINIINCGLLIWYNKRRPETGDQGRIYIGIIISANALFLSSVVGSVILVQLLTLQGGDTK